MKSIWKVGSNVRSFVDDSYLIEIIPFVVPKLNNIANIFLMTEMSWCWEGETARIGNEQLV